MKLLRVICRAFCYCATLSLLGCSYIEAMFPDKERDYQYTSELPMLNYPTELRRNQVANTTSVTRSLDSNSQASTENTALNDSDTAAEQSPSESDNTDVPPKAQPVPGPTISNTELTPADETDTRDTVSSVQIIQFDDGESRLRLGSGQTKAWRVVNKALTRNTIEVTRRNPEQGKITLQYDPDEEKATDDSFWDEISFLFKGININDKEYVVKLEEHGQETDVIILNEEQLPLLNDDAALRLLKVIADTIKSDLTGKAK